MAHGQPDFGMYSIASTIYRLADMGELAARLGSIVTFDRRGDIVWLDDFEDDIGNWELAYAGTGALIAASAERARNGGFCAKLTTSDVANNTVIMYHRNPFPVVSKVGIEASFTINDNMNNERLDQYLRDGSYYHSAQLRYLPLTNVLQYWGSGGAFVPFVTDLVPLGNEYLFHTLKYVIDLSTFKYVRAIFDDVEYDMSALLYEHDDSLFAPYWEQVFRSQTNINSNQTVYLDDVILTQNEP